MAYIGKEFKFGKEEKYEEFINALGSSDEKAFSFLSFKPSITLLKNGDGYTLVLSMKESNFKKEIPFKAGVSFDEEIGQAAIKAKSVINVDGDVFTQVQDFGNGILTIKREFSADQVKVTVSSSLTDAVAYRYYVAA